MCRRYTETIKDVVFYIDQWLFSAIVESDCVAWRCYSQNFHYSATYTPYIPQNFIIKYHISWMSIEETYAADICIIFWQTNIAYFMFQNFLIINNIYLLSFTNFFLCQGKWIIHNKSINVINLPFIYILYKNDEQKIILDRCYIEGYQCECIIAIRPITYLLKRFAFVALIMGFVLVGSSLFIHMLKDAISERVFNIYCEQSDR